MTLTKPELATDMTRHILNESHDNQHFNWQDKRDFDFARRGLIAKAPLKDIQNTNGEVVWGCNWFEYSYSYNPL